MSYLGWDYASQKRLLVSSTTAVSLVNELMKTHEDHRLLRLQEQLAASNCRSSPVVRLLHNRLQAVNELGFVPLSMTSAELLFELISQGYKRGSLMITSNLPLTNGPGPSASNA